MLLVLLKALSADQISNNLSIGTATIDPPTIDPPTIDPPTIDPPCNYTGVNCRESRAKYDN